MEILMDFAERSSRRPDFRRGGKIYRAEEWSSHARILRMLAQKGLLGRKFLVDGQWIDMGTGKVEEPPSHTVKFYVAFQ